MQTGLARPFRPMELGSHALAFFALPALSEDLTRQSEYERSGVSAVTIARDAHVTVVLVASRKGAVVREHRAPSAATVVLCSGRVRFRAAAGDATDLEPGSLAVFAADVPHAVEALEDAVYLVIIGGRKRRSAGAHADGTSN